MNATYEVYKLTSAGLRESLLMDYQKLDAELNWSKGSKLSLTGTSLGTVPLSLGSRIAVDRNMVQIYSGIVTKLSVECEDCVNNVVTWEAETEGDDIVLGWRYVFATEDNIAPASIAVGEDLYDKIPNNNNENSTRSALDRMLYYIRKHAGPNAHSSRRLVTVAENDDNSRGEQGRSAYHIRALDNVVEEIGRDSSLRAVVATNRSGARVLTIPSPRDRTASVVVSPEFGNVAGWEKEEKYPKFNACWVISGTGETEKNGRTYETRVWVYAEDSESVAKYGRIESVINKNDVKIVQEDEDTPAVTKAEVRKLLEAEARSRLKDAAAVEKWTVTMMETDGCAFMDDWQLGDRVKCVINGLEFTSQIETVEIEYENGTEIVTPTIGGTENGLFGDLYKMLYGIDKRLKKEEEK